MKQTITKLKTLQIKDTIVLLENIIRGGISSVMEHRYVKLDDNKEIIYITADNLYGCAISQSPPNDEIKFNRNFDLENILNTPDDSNIGYFSKVDLSYLDNVREKTKNIPFCPKNRIYLKRAARVVWFVANPENNIGYCGYTTKSS